MNHTLKCSFFQEYKFVALCASIFVEIQKSWFSIDGLFLRDVFFFNIVKIVEFCLKNLLSEKHWHKCLKCLSLRCLLYALSVLSKLPQMFYVFSFLQK